MENIVVPQDDLLDVMEMTKNFENYIFSILNENDVIIGMAALMTATVNCTFNRCDTLDEVLFYRNMLVQIFDNSILSTHIKESKRHQSF